MRKFTLLFLTLLVTIMSYGAGGWATSAVSLTKDGGSAYLYTLNNEGWTDGTWGSNTAFGSYDFGTPTSLIMNGGNGNAWADGGDFYDGTSFIIYYRVYKNGDTPGSWSSISLSNQTYHNGNNYIYEKSDAGVDLLALASAAGTNVYTLEVVMAKNQYWSGGNWNSMVPGGQETAYNAATAGFKASFTKSTPTAVDKVESTLKLNGANGKVTAHFNGEANVQLYSVSGQLICSKVVANEFVQTSATGAYILCINGKAHKVIVQK